MNLSISPRYPIFLHTIVHDTHLYSFLFLHNCDLSPLLFLFYVSLISPLHITLVRFDFIFLVIAFRSFYHSHPREYSETPHLGSRLGQNTGSQEVSGSSISEIGKRWPELNSISYHLVLGVSTSNQ